MLVQYLKAGNKRVVTMRIFYDLILRNYQQLNLIIIHQMSGNLKGKTSQIEQQTKYFQRNKNFQQKNRIFIRQYKNHRFYRKVIINLKEQGQLLKSKEMSNEQYEKQIISKIEQEQLQNSIQSQFVILNLCKQIEKKKLILVQQDYNCFLNDLNLENLSFQKRIGIFCCILYGIKDLQQKLIVHGSLSTTCISIVKVKNNNIMAKINCFQRAKTLQNPKSLIESSNIALNAYSAPEVRNRSNYGLMADIWSLGCLLNYILYETLYNIWQTDQQTHIEVPDGTPDWLLQLLRSMLHYNPHKRYTIQTIIAIIKSTEKCMDILKKSILCGYKSLKLKKIPSQLNSQKQN